MALHAFPGMEIGVPASDALARFCGEIGPCQPSVWGTADPSEQIPIVEARYRRFETMRIACEDEADAAAIEARLDRHNLLIPPGPIPYLNHDVFEFVDTDAVGQASAGHLARYGDDVHVIGLGRHAIGANAFWCMVDPCGTMFESFCGMDDLVDADAWGIETNGSPADFAAWGPKAPPPELVAPADLADIAKAREEGAS